MKRILWIVVSIAVLGGVGLWSMRFFGESQIDRRLNQVQAQAEARGWAVTWGERSAEGFPVANRVRLKDVALVSKTGVLIRAPELTIARDEAATEALAVRLPSEINLTVPVGQLTRESNPILPERLNVTISTEDALARVGAGENGEITAILNASSLRAAIDQQDFPVKLAVEAGTVTFETDPAEAARRLRLRASTFGVDLRDTSGGGTSVIDSRYTDLAIGATVRASDLAGFIKALGEMSEKLADGAFQSASQSITVSILQPGGGGRPSSLTWTAGPQTGLFQIDKGTLGYSAEDRDIAATLSLPTPQGFVSYKATALFYQRQFELPIIGTGETPRPGSLRIAVEDFLPDDESFALVDPDARLGRDPADLVFDAKGTLRLLLGQRGFPVEFSNISLATFRLAAAGAVAEASGDVEILQPINLPLGEIKVAVTGGAALIGKLKAAGILDDKLAETARAILQVYARPDPTADRHETEVSFTGDGMLINGRTTDGRTPADKAAEDLDPTKPRDDSGGEDGPASDPSEDDSASPDEPDGAPKNDGGAGDASPTEDTDAPEDPETPAGTDEPANE